MNRQDFMTPVPDSDKTSMYKCNKNITKTDS